MKHISLIVAAALMILSSCTQSLDPDTNSGSRKRGIVSFSTPILASISAKPNPPANTASTAQAANAGSIAQAISANDRSYGKTDSQAASASNAQSNDASTAQASTQPSSVSSQKANTKSAAASFSPTTSFCVYANHYSSSFTLWSEGANFFGANGDIVSHQSSVLSESSISYDAWVSSNKHYWPATGSLSFQAYAPASNSIPEGNSISPIAPNTSIISATGVDATVSLNPARAQQIDFLFSERVVNQVQNSKHEGTPNLYGVQVPFHHALARITFSAMLNGLLPDGDYIKITSIVLKNLKTTGNFSQNLIDSSSSAVVSETSPTWIASGDLYDYANAVCAEPANLSTKASDEDYSEVYIIPQEIDDDFEIFITYKSKTGTNPEDTFEYTISKAVLAEAINSENFEIGKSYNFVFCLGESLKIYFDPLVNDWNDWHLSSNIHLYI